MYYNVTTWMPSITGAAELAMPETEPAADVLSGTQDSLLAGVTDPVVQDASLASAALDPASEKLFGESGSGLLASV